MSEMLSAALDYASRGWPIFPCDREKKPIVEGGVLAATTDVKTIKRWWSENPKANIGLDVGGAGMMVVDLDPGHDRAALERQVDLPETMLRQRSPRGGEHLFYALADGELVPPSASKVAPHVDIRSFHSYVLLSPSATADGEYTWTADDWPAPKPAFRSDALVKASQAARSKSEDRDKWLIEPDAPEHIRKASEWLKHKAKIAVEGQGGDHTAYATAAMMKSFAISPEKALDLMLEHWNPRCNPPWGEGEIDHLRAKVEHAYSYNTSPPGNMTDAYQKAKAAELFQPVGRSAGSGFEISAGRFRIVNRAGADDVEDPEWLITDLLPRRSFGLLVGGRASFKSFVAIDAGLTLATGKGDLWKPNGDTRNVLMAVGEGRSGIKKRLQAWEKHHKAKASSFYLIDPVPQVARPEDRELFTKLALEMQPQGFDLVILDTVGRSMAGVNENAQEHASAFTALVEHIQRELGCAVLGLHHTGHEGAKRARGSSVFEADTDTVILAERDEKAMQVTLTMTKQKDAPEWEHPKVLRLEEVKLDKGKSLVAMPTDAKSEAKEAPVSRDTSGRRGKRGPGTSIPLEIVDTAAVQVLRSVKNGKLSSAELARMIAHKLGSGVSESTVRQQYLRHHLKCDSRFTAYKQYDPVTDRWNSLG